MVHLDVAAVQRHRTVVVECLRDGDVSIRKRALDLVYCLVNADNVKPLTKELLNYLVCISALYLLGEHLLQWVLLLQQVADADTKPDLCAKIAAVADKFAPSKRWHIDTLVSMLAFAGNNVKRVAMSQTLFLISHATEDHAAVTHKLFAMAQASATPSQEAQQALLQIAVWVIGEYGELLLKSPPSSSPAADELSPPFGEVRTEHDVSSALLSVWSGRLRLDVLFSCRSCAC